MSKRAQTVFLAVCMVTTATFFSVVRVGATPRGGQAVRNIWSPLKGYVQASSVVWSPKGDRIAFVAAHNLDIADDGSGLKRATIWVLSLSKGGHPARLRKLVVLNRKQGIPAGLFWLDDNRLGWASAHYSKTTYPFTFMQMSLNDARPKRLTSQTFIGMQTWAEQVASIPGAPNDVYYDSASHILLFTAHSPAGDWYVRSISLSTGRSKQLSFPQAKGNNPAALQFSDVTICGSLVNANNPVFYVAAGVGAMDPKAYEDTGEYLWRSNSYNLSWDQILISKSQRQLYFPRISPDGKMLAYLSLNGVRPAAPFHVVVRDVRAERQETLTTIPYAIFYLAPATGCPFSWSPDGKRIAYADGSRIKIVDVPQHIGSKKK